MAYILTIDEGTTGVTVLLIDHQGKIAGRAYQEIKQYYPQPGWVEHDPMEIWKTTWKMMEKVLENGKVNPGQIQSIGITNQRETTIIWNRKTGKPVYPAIVWQCRRTAPLCDSLRKKGLAKKFQKKTGLVLDAYFSGTKVHWILNHLPGLRTKMAKGELAFGTIDSWLIWNLTGGAVHATDYTNASRTLLFNIHSLTWDKEILNELKINLNLLPEVKPSIGLFGKTISLGKIPSGIPITGVAGDQQAALFGQTCFESGMAKNTYGTGCFLLFNTGEKAIYSRYGLLTTLCCSPSGKPQYALEGSVFVAGAAIQWLRDEMKFISKSEETEKLAQSVPDTMGIYLVPAFVGLGAPYWDMHARGIITGLTRGAGRAHLIRAAVEAIAYQTRDLVETIQKETGIKLKSLKVDGGAVKNNFLMQFQADILGIAVDRPKNIESTATGAAFLSGLGSGFWSNTKELMKCRTPDRLFIPQITEYKRDMLYSGWLRAVGMALTK